MGLVYVTLDVLVHDDLMPFLYIDWNPWLGLLHWDETEWSLPGLGLAGLGNASGAWQARPRHRSKAAGKNSLTRARPATAGFLHPRH